MEKLQLAFLAGIVVLGISAQWVAWRLRLPAILVLLVAGFAAGRFVTGQGMPLHDVIDEELLFPLVSLSVAVILFEGGMSLRLRELADFPGVVVRLVTVGAAVTWLLSTGLILLLFDFQLWLAALTGAILVVTGPTVIVPLLQHVRPTRRLWTIAKWEGIVIDPIGAVLAVLVFEAALNVGEAARTSIAKLGLTLLVGSVAGGLGALFVIRLLRSRRIPDFLDNPVLLAVVFATYAASNSIQAESGLLTVTVMGIVLANQRRISVQHLIEFKENLRTLLISVLFILLAARVEWGQIADVGLPGLGLLAGLILVVRPASVVLATWRTPLGWREKLFLCAMAPRGIVAAAVSSVFALRIAAASTSPALDRQAEQMVSSIYLVIVGTVTFYGLAAAPLARRLGLANPNPQGILFAGATPVVRAIAEALRKHEFDVLLVDRNRDHVRVARMAGLPVVQANVLSEYVRDQYDLGGIGRMLAMTPNDEVNSLAALQYADIFGRSGVYQLPSQARDTVQDEAASFHLRGQLLFARDATYARLAAWFAEGAVVKSTTLTTEFDFEKFRVEYGQSAIVMFVVDEFRKLRIVTVDSKQKFRPGDTLISLVMPADDAA